MLRRFVASAPWLTSWLRGDHAALPDKVAQPARPDQGHRHQAPWYATLWLTGVDYFSSLGYAPGLAFLAAGFLAPIATLILVLVTFAAAVPVYALVAKHSLHGEGSIKMIERLTTGWGRLGWLGKTLVLVLLGFAMTDFVITITLSAADASLHIIENPLWPGEHGGSRVTLTAVLILMLCAVFLKGFREAIGLAVLIAVPYMVLNAIIIVAGFVQLSLRPDLVAAWWSRVANFQASDLKEMIRTIDPAHAGDPLSYMQGSGFLALIGVSLIVFPKLALGLSGFETGVSVMPLIAGRTDEERVVATRKLLLAAATLMTVELFGSSIVSSILIPAEEFGPSGRAHGRALAYLAHAQLGPVFGTIYDIATVAILWFAGASAMAGLLNILPRYLPRFGMSPSWIEYPRPLVLVLTAVCLWVNWSFDANVEAQGGAYATGVLVLMASGAFAVMLAEWDKPSLRFAFSVILAVFLYVLVVNVVERPDGIRIAGIFIAAVIAASLWSRWQRASEVRVQAFEFEDAESERLWHELRAEQHQVVIPLRSCDAEGRKNALARSLLHLEVERSTTPCFLHVELTEDPSQFASPIRIKVTRDGGEYVINVTNAVAVANAIAYVSMALEAEEVVIGLLESGTPVLNAILYLLFGTGEVGYAVRSIFVRIREERIGQQLAMRNTFDRERDRKEKELLREMVAASPEERQAALRTLFQEEADRFAVVVPTQGKLPLLILVG